MKNECKHTNKRKEERKAFFKQLFFILFAEAIGIGGTIIVLILTR